MATTAPTAERQHGHGIDLSDLDLDGVPATHRHAIRALRERFAETDGISIRHVKDTCSDTVVFLDVESKSDLLGTYDLKRALSDTAVNRAELRTGTHTAVKLDYRFGFEV